MAKTFKVPVYWEMAGYITVEAENEKEALEVAKGLEGECVLPETQNTTLLEDGGDYVEGSFRTDDVSDGVIPVI